MTVFLHWSHESDLSEPHREIFLQLNATNTDFFKMKTLSFAKRKLKPKIFLV